MAKLDNCLVIGNGESRKNIDLNQFKEHYTLIGCNALYRDIIPEHLVCCDRRMIEEVVTSLEKTNCSIHVREDWFRYYRKIRKNKNIFQLPEIPYESKLRIDDKRNWGSGTFAVLVAAQMEFTEINLLGFDLYSRNKFVNNVYKNTPNYSATDSQSVDPSYWIHQLYKIFCLYQNKNFTILNTQDWIMPDKWHLPNVRFKNLNDFLIDNKYSSSIITT